MAKTHSVLNSFLAILGTVFILIGFAMLIERGSSNLPVDLYQAAASLDAAIATTSTWRALLVDDEGARLITDDGVRGLAWPVDRGVTSAAPTQLVGVILETGELAYLGDEFKLLKSAGLRSPSGRRVLLPAAPRADGTGVVTMREGPEDRALVMRLPSGEGVSGVRGQPVGWWDEDTAAVTGVASSSFALFAVKLTGEVKLVAPLPETAVGLSVRPRGEAIYVTAVPGEGLESPPRPPSELHRITLDGGDAMIAREDSHVIGRYVLSMKGLAYENGVAYGLDDGTMAVKMGEQKVAAGLGVPIAFADGRLFFKRGQELWVRDVQAGTEKKLVDLRGDAGALFPL